MKFTLSSDLITLLPGTIVSFALVRNIKVTGPDSTTDKILNEICPKTKRKYNLETLLQDKNTQAYLDLCKQLNVSSDSAFLPHLQVKRVLKDKKIGNINNIVNHYMTIELLNNISVSAYDFDILSGDVEVTIASQGDEMITIGGHKVVVPKGDLVITDTNGVIYSFSQGYRDISKVTSNTKDVLFVIDAPDGIGQETVELSTSQLCNKYPNKNFVILSKQSPDGILN